MKRVDLRHLKGEFLGKLKDDLHTLKAGEVRIYLFEIGEFENVEKSINLAIENGCEIMNSLKFNQVDWTIVVKKEIK